MNKPETALAEPEADLSDSLPGIDFLRLMLAFKAGGKGPLPRPRDASSALAKSVKQRPALDHCSVGPEELLLICRGQDQGRIALPLARVRRGICPLA